MNAFQRLGNLDHAITMQLPQLVRTNAARATQQALDLHGWDMAFGIRMPKANAAITAAWNQAGNDPAQSPLPLAFQGQRTFFHVNYTISGKFGAWQIAQGGSAAILKMVVPITEGLVSDGTATDDQKFSAATANISVQLGFIPRQAPSGPAGEPHDLKVSSGTNLPKPVVVDQLTIEDTSVDPSLADLLRPFLEDWFAANMDDFRYVFATVSLNAVADNQDWSWVKPTSTAFSYAQPNPAGNPKDEDCILGVLSTVSGRDSSGLDLSLDETIIPATADAGLAVATPVYFLNNLIPHIHESFDGASVSDFAVVPDQGGAYSITNVNAVTMTIPSKKGEYQKALVQPKSFTSTIFAGELQTRILNATIQVSPGINLLIDYTIHTGIKLTGRDDKQQALVMYDAQPIEQSHQVQQDPGVTIGEVAGAIIAGCLLAGVGESGGVAAQKAFVETFEASADSILGRIVKWIVKGVIIGIPSGLVGSISDMVAANAEENANKLPPFDPFAKEAASTTEWSGTGTYKLQSVVYNGGLLLGLVENPAGQ